MLRFLLIFSFCEAITLKDIRSNCVEHHNYAPMCIYYYSDDCLPWLITELCSVKNIVPRDYHCVSYTCPDSFKAQFSKQLRSEIPITNVDSELTSTKEESSDIENLTAPVLTEIRPPTELAVSKRSDVTTTTKAPLLNPTSTSDSYNLVPLSTTHKLMNSSFLKTNELLTTLSTAASLTPVNRKTNKMSDPCESYDCDETTGYQSVCHLYTRGPYDTDCHIPCKLDNCTEDTRLDDFACITYQCIPNWSPIEPIPPQPQSSKTGVYVGIGFGILGLLMVICGLAFYWWRKRKQIGNNQNPEAPTDSNQDQNINQETIPTLPSSGMFSIGDHDDNSSSEFYPSPNHHMDFFGNDGIHNPSFEEDYFL